MPRYWRGQVVHRRLKRYYAAQSLSTSRPNGVEHPVVAGHLRQLGQLLIYPNRADEGETLVRRALAIYEDSSGEHSLDVGNCLYLLAHLSVTANRPEEAISLLRRVLMIDENQYGCDHPRVATSANALAQSFQELNLFSDAQPLMRKSVSLLLKSTTENGYEHPHLAVALNNYEALLHQLECSDEEIRQEFMTLFAEHGPNAG